jgi:hypothetical protein
MAARVTGSTRKLAELLRTHQLKSVYHGEHGVRTTFDSLSLRRSHEILLDLADVEKAFQV